MTEVVAIVPARGGSKGIPRKNLQTVGGIPLLVRAILAARHASTVTRTVVSTDDDEIAAESVKAGGEVVRRPAAIAGDTASSESVLLHAADELSLADDTVVLLLQCTSPFTTESIIDSVTRAVRDGGADTAFSARPFHGFTWRTRSDGQHGVQPLNHDAGNRERRQDRSPEYVETGAVYAMTMEGLRRHGSRFHGHVSAVLDEGGFPTEVDEPPDLALARAWATEVSGPQRYPRDEAPKLVALDFDGVFTDNTVLVDERGLEAVKCHRGDGHGLSRLREYVPVVVFSTEENPVVSARCEKLGIDAVQGLGDNKADAISAYAAERNIELRDVLFVGNDVNDLETLALVGVPVAVADAAPEVLNAAEWVLPRNGGQGALRFLADALMGTLEGGKCDD